jgi:hypothetical protein
MTKKRFSCLGLFGAIGWSLSTQSVLAGGNKEMSYPDLVSRLYDMQILSTPPQIGEKSGAFTNWDRTAYYDQSRDTYVNWHANNDGSGFMDDQGTMMKLDGPEVIWPAMPKKGAVEFYIDGAEEPVICGPFIDLFNYQKPPFNYPQLVHMKARGQNFLSPSPFRNRFESWGKRIGGNTSKLHIKHFLKGQSSLR